MSFNQVTVVGNATKNPEVRYVTGRDLAVAKFSLAINEKRKDIEKTVFVEITAFGKLGEICGEYIKKGDLVLISGKLDSQEWEDKESGKKRSRLIVVGKEVRFLSKRDNKDNNADSYSSSDDFNADDIPF